MNLFFDPNLEPKLGEFSLNQEESLHLSKVLRFKAGQEVFLTNGRGHFFKAIIKEVKRKATLLEILEVEEKETTHPQFSLAVAPLKNAKRMDWLLEKLVEVGIGKLYMIQTFHTERSKLNPERIQKIMVGAMKQSLQCHLPELSFLPFEDLMENLPKGHQKIMAHCEPDAEKLFLPQICQANPCTKKLLLIGPEGDFADFEILRAKEAGFQMADLGKQRLRTETAAISGLIWMNTFCQMTEKR